MIEAKAPAGICSRGLKNGATGRVLGHVRGWTARRYVSCRNTSCVHTVFDVCLSTVRYIPSWLGMFKQG